MHVNFIHILLPQFMIDCLVGVLLFEVGHISVSIGIFDACVWYYFWHLQVRKVRQCLGHDGVLEAISVGRAKAPLQFLQCNVNVPRSKLYPSRSLHRPLKLVSSSSSRPWVLVHIFSTLYILVFYACPLIFSVGPFNSVHSGYQDGLILTMPFKFSHSYV